MKNNNILKIASVYIGVVLGAGFLSGQEILNFFVKYEYLGLLGCILSGFAFYKIGYMVLNICNENSIYEFGEFLNLVMGRKIGSVIENCVAIFMLILFATMLAGGGAAIHQRFDFNYLHGVYLIAIITFCVFLFDLNGLVKVNIILTPIMTIGALLIGIHSIFFSSQTVFNPIENTPNLLNNWISSAIIYISYNIATGIGVLTNLTPFVENKKIAHKSSLISGFIMSLLALLIAISLLLNGNSAESEIPIMEVLSNLSKNIQWIYFTILMMAILTTALGNGFAFIQWFEKKHNLPPILIKFSLVLIGSILAHFGFSNFVKVAYPLLSIIGFLEIFFIFNFSRRQKIN